MVYACETKAGGGRAAPCREEGGEGGDTGKALVSRENARVYDGIGSMREENGLRTELAGK